jgi:5-methylcytosine-specific restriction endonuclease McrA
VRVHFAMPLRAEPREREWELLGILRRGISKIDNSICQYDSACAQEISSISITSRYIPLPRLLSFWIRYIERDAFQTKIPPSLSRLNAVLACPRRH